jgi:hypothetical protein
MRSCNVGELYVVIRRFTIIVIVAVASDGVELVCVLNDRGSVVVKALCYK